MKNSDFSDEAVYTSAIITRIITNPAYDDVTPYAIETKCIAHQENITFVGKAYFIPSKGQFSAQGTDVATSHALSVLQGNFKSRADFVDIYEGYDWLGVDPDNKDALIERALKYVTHILHTELKATRHNTLIPLLSKTINPVAPIHLSNPKESLPLRVVRNIIGSIFNTASNRFLAYRKITKQKDLTEHDTLKP